MKAETKEERERIKAENAKVFSRFRSCFPLCNDVGFATILGVRKQVVAAYKSGKNRMEFYDIAKRFPEIDYNYVLTGRKTEDKNYKSRVLLQKQLITTNKTLLELAKNLQIIAEENEIE